MNENNNLGQPRVTGAQSRSGYVVAIDAFEFTRGATFSRLFELLWARKLWIIAFGLAGSVAGTAISFFLTPVYESSVVTVWKGDDTGGQSLGGLVGGQLGSLASAAGLLQGGESSQSEALAVIRSDQFSRRFIEQEDLLAELFAEHWDEANAGWSADRANDPPTLADGAERFRNRTRRISQEVREQTITIRMRSRSPERAAELANAFVALANTQLQTQRIADAQNSIDFLAEQLKTQDSLEIQSAIYRMMESQLSTIVFAQVRPDFAFRIVDPAVPSDTDDEVWPSKPLFLFVGGLIGGLLGVGLVLLRSRQGETVARAD